MRFFDLIAFPGTSSDPMAARLGYKKIFVVGKDVEVLEGAADATPAKKIIGSDDLETVTKALRQNSVLGLLPKGALPGKKALDAVKENEKLLFIPLSQATCAEGTARVQALARMRKLVRSTLMGKVPFALVSMAESRDCMMSSLQMIEVAGFLGIDATRAKEALGMLGGLV